MKNKHIITFSLLFISLIGNVQATFTDNEAIPSWATQAIHGLKHLDIISGNPDGTIRPNTTINRAEFCKIIVQATKTSLEFPAMTSFPDVTKEDWFYTYVETAKKKGWLKGYPDGTFQPGQTINRAEVAKILSQAFNIQPTQHINTGQWYHKYFSALNTQSLLAHNSAIETIDPEKKPSRAEILDQVYRTMKLKRYFEEANIPALPGIETEEETTPSTTSGGYVEPPALTSTSSTPSGALTLTKISDTKRISPSSGSAFEALSVNVQATKRAVQVSALQIRRIGNGSYSDFDQVWVEINGARVSNKVIPQNDLIVLPFQTTDSIPQNSTKTYTIRATVASNAQTGSSRFVLYLPEWIESNTLEKTGFFPFGGVDIEVK